MEEVNTTEQQPASSESVQEDKVKKEHKRSSPYPQYTLDSAYEFALKVNEKFSSQQITREEIAHVLGLHVNTVSTYVSACAQFGLFDRERDEQARYTISALFKDIFHYESENHRKIALIQAFGTPKLYTELISKFDNSTIPAELPNTLIKHHNITETAASAAADVFIKSGMFAGVINDNRLLKYSITKSTLAKTQPYTEVIEEPAGDVPPIQPVQQATTNAVAAVPAVIEPYILAEMKQVPIHLTKDKSAFFAYPKDMSEKDIRLVKHQIDGILLRIQLENDEAE